MLKYFYNLNVIECSVFLQNHIFRFSRCARHTARDKMYRALLKEAENHDDDITWHIDTIKKISQELKTRGDLLVDDVDSYQVMEHSELYALIQLGK